MPPGKDDVVINIRVALEAAKKNLSRMRNEIGKLKSVSVGKLKSVAGAQQGVLTLQNKLTAATSKSKMEFAGWALSIMFAGMAMQRMFSQIWKTGQKSFQDVMHSVEGTVTGFDMMQGSIKYLGFSIGQALEPLAFMLIPFIDKITEIVQKNPEMVASFTKWGTILGGIFTAGGMGVLALNGFIELGTKVGLIDTELLNLSKSKNWGLLGDTASKAMGAIAIGFAVGDAVDSFKDFKEGKWVDGFLNAGASALQGVGGMMMLKSGKAGMKKGSLLILAGVAMDQASQNSFFQSFGQISAFLFASIRTIGDFIAWTFNGNIIQAFNKALVRLSTGSIGKAFEFLSGIDLSDVLDKLTGVESTSFDAGESFKNNMVLANAELKEMDREFAKWKDDIQKPAMMLNDLQNNELTLSFDDIRQLSFDGALDKDLAATLLVADQSKTNLLDEKTERLLNDFLITAQRTSGERAEVSINVNNDLDLLELINAIKESI